jgi:hypothetical protein
MSYPATWDPTFSVAVWLHPWAPTRDPILNRFASFGGGIGFFLGRDSTGFFKKIDS